jgi:hypothetical protein
MEERSEETDGLGFVSCWFVGFFAVELLDRHSEFV